MTWESRIREAAYTSPSGKRYTFEYENVSLSVTKHTIAYDFPDAIGTHIQDLGRSGRKFPLRVIIWGENYDQEAADFVDAVLEPGVGKLEHPIYGVINTVPFGQIKRRDDLKTSANQAIIEVSFWETIGTVFPSSQVDPAASVIQSVDEFNDASSQQFRFQMELDTVAEQSQVKGSYQLVLDSVDGVMGVIADTQKEVQNQFDAVRDSINSSIDTLLGDPVTLAFQSLILVQAPARANAAIAARLDGYRTLVDSMITQTFELSLNAEIPNQFHSADLFAGAYISGAALSVVNNQFETKADALLAADFILTMMDDYTAWRDVQFETLEQIDTGESYQQLIEAVGVAAGFLVQISFTLKQEKLFTTVRQRNFLELCAELYGNVNDDTLDFFINSNDLTGQEIIEIPTGREIVYYV